MATPFYDYEFIPDRDSRRWAMFVHLGGLARLTMIPLGAVVVPVLLWLMARDRHPYIDIQGREAINFQLTMSLINFVLVVLAWILSWIYLRWILWPIFPIILLAQIGGSIYAAIQANKGEPFRYPFTIRFLN